MIGRIHVGDWVEVGWWNGETVRPRVGQVVKTEEESDRTTRRGWRRHYTVEFFDGTKYVYQRGHLRKKMGGQRRKTRA